MAKSALPPAATHDVTAGADMPLDGKVAIVTGASRGIGRAISRRLAAHGTRVVVASRTEVDTSRGSPHQKYASGTIFDTANAIEAAGWTALPDCGVAGAANG
jgi:NAD(P)-dependent dehydrogenase (short-subunit alcohol dehydrogenase family)